MVTRAVTLTSDAGSITLETERVSTPAVTAMAGFTGLGLPDVDTQWLSGAGDGASFRSGRNLPREFSIPVKITGLDEADLLARVSLLGQILSLDVAPARLSWTAADGHAWWVDVVRVAGGQFVAGDMASTDLKTVLRTTLVLRSGDPFWTREDAVQQEVTPSSGRGLLGTGRSLTMLRVSSSQAMGQVPVDNPGDAPAPWTAYLTGPGTALDLVSPSGEVLHWSGTLLAGERRVFDRGRCFDPDDPDPETANHYDELGPAPRFWLLPPGSSTITVELAGAASGSSVVLSWRPRRQLVI